MPGFVTILSFQNFLVIFHNIRKIQSRFMLAKNPAILGKCEFTSVPHNLI